MYYILFRYIIYVHICMYMCVYIYIYIRFIATSGYRYEIQPALAPESKDRV